MIIKMFISCLIPIVLFFLFIALVTGVEGGYESDNLNYFCFCVTVGIIGLVCLIEASGIVYGILFG